MNSLDVLYEALADDEDVLNYVIDEEIDASSCMIGNKWWADRRNQNQIEP